MIQFKIFVYYVTFGKTDFFQMNNHFYDMFMLGTFLDLLNKNMIFKGIEKKFNEMSYYK